MAKLENYNGSVQLMAGITQKGGGDFALIDANAVQTKEDGTRLDAELETIFSMASKNDKRLTNLEQGYGDDFFVTGDTGYVETRVVPENALPYAEVKKVHGALGRDSGGILYPKKPLRVESWKEDTPKMLDATLDTSEMVDTMTVEKLADGCFKFNGYTGTQDQRSCKFATVDLPEGSYCLTYKIISNTNNVSFYICCNGEHLNSTTYNESSSINGGTAVLEVIIDQGTAGTNRADDLIISLEVLKGSWISGESSSGYKFVGEMILFATLEIPEALYNLDGYGVVGNYIDFESKKFVKTRAIIDNKSTLLEVPEEIDISAYLSDDNFIEVVPNGLIRVIQDTGEIMSCRCEIVFMTKGV